ATLALLEGGTPYQAWLQTAERLPSARPEPAFESWKTVRWALQDATTQLYRYYFEIEQVEQLSELLDQTADDLHRSFGR
ncbi:MAG TPA: hypothetical protein VLS48_05730, partial [Anaerolineales bacterium]|nr:hypothetical protein [Anaerolineales bacterium]